MKEIKKEIENIIFETLKEKFNGVYVEKYDNAEFFDFEFKGIKTTMVFDKEEKSFKIGDYYELNNEKYNW